jgi:hypothetical protein
MALVLNNIGQLYYESGEYQKAIDNYDQAPRVNFVGWAAPRWFIVEL